LAFVIVLVMICVHMAKINARRNLYCGWKCSILWVVELELDQVSLNHEGVNLSLFIYLLWYLI